MPETTPAGVCPVRMFSDSYNRTQQLIEEPHTSP